MILLAFLRYSLFSGQSRGSFLIRVCSSGRLIIRELACSADLFIRLRGLGRLALMPRALVSAFFHLSVIMCTALWSPILIGMFSS